MNIQMLKNNLWKRRQVIEAKIAIFWGHEVIKETTLLEEIQKNNTKKQKVQKELVKEEKQVWEDNEIVYMDGQIYISNNKKIWKWILQENHNLVNIEYPGQQRMLNLIKRNYWWPEIWKNIKKHVSRCQKCQQNKV